MPDKERTDRGFRIFGRVKSCHQEPVVVRVQESSLAFQGAHVWIHMEGECVDHLGDHMPPAGHLDVAGASALIAALCAFVTEAEAGELMEPARREPEE